MKDKDYFIFPNNKEIENKWHAIFNREAEALHIDPKDHVMVAVYKPNMNVNDDFAVINGEFAVYMHKVNRDFLHVTRDGIVICDKRIRSDIFSYKVV